VKVLFLCPHGAAKSVIAVSYFNQLVRQRKLAAQGDSAGTDPSAEVAPLIVEMLNREGIDVTGFRPCRVTDEQLDTADFIVSLGCTPEELGLPAERIAKWDDIPLLSQDFEAARLKIRAHVDQLITQLQGAVS